MMVIEMKSKGMLVLEPRVYEVDASLCPDLVPRYPYDAADFVPYRDRMLAERRHAWIGV